MRFSDLLGKPVISESGWPFGHVVDVRVELSGKLPKVTDLLVGPRAFAERVLGGPQVEGGGQSRPHARIAWEDVVSVDDSRVLVGEKTKLLDEGGAA